MRSEIGPPFLCLPAGRQVKKLGSSEWNSLSCCCLCRRQTCALTRLVLMGVPHRSADGASRQLAGCPPIRGGGYLHVLTRIARDVTPTSGLAGRNRDDLRFVFLRLQPTVHATLKDDSCHCDILHNWLHDRLLDC